MGKAAKKLEAAPPSVRKARKAAGQLPGSVRQELPVIGYREALALRAALRDGALYVGGYGPMFEAAMVCQAAGLLEAPEAAQRLVLTARGRQAVSQIPTSIEDGWSMAVDF